MTKAIREEGAIAFRTGFLRSTNPYAVVSEDWIEWMDGFDAAATQASHPHEVSTSAEHVTIR